MIERKFLTIVALSFTFIVEGGADDMVYSFMTFEDDTEITHSEMLPNGEVRVFVETPDEKDCFHSMVCYLPSYRVENVIGYSQAEIDGYVSFIKKAANLIMEFSQEGGFNRATAI